jgi:hypothetical protein
MADLDELRGFYFVDIHTRQIPGRGREWVVGVQERRGDAVLRVSDPNLNAAVREAVKMSKRCRRG